MGILSIDQSLSNSGIVIWKDDQEHFLNIKTKDISNHITKIIYIREQLKELIYKYNINTIIREGFSFHSTGQSVFQLGGLGYMIDVIATDLMVDLYIIPPSTHKKFTTGKGNSPKSVMLLYIFKNWGIELKDDNVADAYSMIKTYEAYINYMSADNIDELTKEKKKLLEAFAKIDMYNYIEKGKKDEKK